MTNERRIELKDMEHHIDDILLQPSRILLLFYDILNGQATRRVCVTLKS